MYITIYKDNDRPGLSGSITFTGTVPTLTNAAVTLTLIDADDDTTKQVDASATAVTINASSIDWEWSVGVSDYDTLGTYDAYITLTLQNGDVEDIPLSKQIIIGLPYGD